MSTATITDVKKLTVNSSDLKQVLASVSIAVSSNPVLPILEDFHFEVESNRLTVKATDLEMTFSDSVEVQSNDNFSIAIPAKILLDTLKELPSQPITITVKEKNQIVIKSSYGKYKLAGEEASDFPSTPTLEDCKTIKLETATLLRGINNVSFATSNDELRPAMTGIYFELGAGELIMTATDAHKLATYSTRIENQESLTAILPKKAMLALKNELKGDMVEISINETNACFIFDSKRVTCRRIDARYPDYRAVIPQDYTKLLTVNRNDFKSALKRIALFANKTTNQVVIDVIEGGMHQLKVSSQDLDFSNEANESLTCEFEGEPIKIGFNAKFLIEMLNVLEGEEVVIEMTEPTRAAILRPTEQKDLEELRMLCMPVMLG